MNFKLQVKRKEICGFSHSNLQLNKKKQIKNQIKVFMEPIIVHYLI